jgi:HEAT repeat protein
MNMRTLTPLLIVLALLLPACLLAQNVADLAAKAASNDAPASAAAYDALKGMGAEGMQGLLKLLAPSDKGGDGAARIALHGLAARLSVRRTPAAPRAVYGQALGDYLKSEAATDCKRFAIVQLGICPSAECVPGLIAVLTSADLAGDAGEALAVNPSPEAKGAMEHLATNPNINVRIRALELLGRLRDPAVRDSLLEGAKAGNGTAVAAYVYQADAVRDGGKPDEARPMYLTALELAKADQLKSLALYGLTGVPQADLLPVVEPLLNTPGTREAAIRAYAAIASRFADEGDKDRGKQMLLHALEVGPSRGLAGEIAAKLRGLGVDIDPARAEGFISRWSVIGPFPGEDIDAEFPPEKGVDLAATIKAGDRDLKWTQQEAIDPAGIVNFQALMQPNQNVTGYMYAEVKVEQAQDVVLKCGSDDGMKLWLNGQQVHRAPQPRSLRVDEDSVEAHLEAGVNKVLVKVVQGGGDWQACVRLTDKDGKVLKFTQ